MPADLIVSDSARRASCLLVLRDGRLEDLLILRDRWAIGQVGDRFLARFGVSTRGWMRPSSIWGYRTAPALSAGEVEVAKASPRRKRPSSSR